MPTTTVSDATATALDHRPPTAGLTHHRSDETSRSTLVFSIKDEIGALDRVLALVSAQRINLSRIDSRPSLNEQWDYDFFIDFDANETTTEALIKTIEPVVKNVRLASSGNATKTTDHAVPWFPRKMADLDEFSSKVLEFGEELDADHPGFTDTSYRERRKMIVENAKKYKTGQPLPRIDYLPHEVETWGAVFETLTKLFPTHACREHQYILPLLMQNCGYRKDSIPQLEDVSKFLHDITGFTLRPVMGLLTSRDFLNGLAFRVFHSTQYIRHHSKPLYTPEPDVCHELLGHAPLFADPDFAEFSQEIGLASLGASDEDIEKLSTIYWFTVEFGVCKEDDKIRAYGAGLLSSFGELEYCLSDKPELRPFEPSVVCTTKYPITSYQPLYYVAESFKDMKDKVREYAASLKRPFSVRYNPYTQMIEVLDKKEKLMRFATSIKADMHVLIDAIAHLS